MKKITFYIAVLATFPFVMTARAESINRKVKPTVITETVVHDTDDPAIWINPKTPQRASSLEQIKIRMAGFMPLI
jgi:3-phytase